VQLVHANPLHNSYVKHLNFGDRVKINVTFGVMVRVVLGLVLKAPSSNSRARLCKVTRMSSGALASAYIILLKLLTNQ